MSAGIITIAATLLGLTYMTCAGLFFGGTRGAKRHRPDAFRVGCRLQPQRAKIEQKR